MTTHFVAPTETLWIASPSPGWRDDPTQDYIDYTTEVTIERLIAWEITDAPTSSKRACPWTESGPVTGTWTLADQGVLAARFLADLFSVKLRLPEDLVRSLAAWNK